MARRRRGDDTPADGSRFMQEWMRRGIGPQHLEKHTVKNDKWDQADYDRLNKEMAEMHAAEGKITDEIPTGGSLFGDTYFSLSKAEPRMEDEGNIRPSHLINRMVMDQAMALPEYDELRSYSVGDDIGSALACIAMEPELETIYDRLKTEQKLAEELAKQEQQLDGAEKTADELMEELERQQQEGDEKGASKTASNAQKNQELINQLRQKLAQGAQELQEQLDNKGPSIRSQMKSAVNKGLDELSGQENSAVAWGLERGQLQRMDPAERLKLAARFNNPKLRRVADLIGPMRRLAFAEQLRKTVHARDEVYDISMGNDLGRVLPMEMASLRHPVRKYDFMRKYLERQLLQYELRGEERVAKGGIICCEDGSGSMSGDPEMWAKAVSICLLHIARAQGRPFTGIHFGSPGEIYVKDFPEPKKISFEDVLDWAEIFFCGGTDFVTPLAKALEQLQREHDTKGAVSGDIVFITDGMCGVPEEWLKAFKEEQARIKFKVYGIIIGGGRADEPLASICDGKVYTIKDLQGGEDVRDIFRYV